MKKLTAIVMLLALCLSLCACSSANQVEAAQTGTTTSAEASTDGSATPQSSVQAKPAIWSLQQTVDEFGDVTANSETILIAPFKGDFSNTATTSSNLNGSMILQKRPDNIHYYASFILYEYGDNPADYSSYDTKTLKVKIGESISQFSLQSVSGNPGLAMGVDPFDYGGDWLLGQLYMGQDLRCIINAGTSQYNFTVESANLPQLMVENGFAIGPAEITAQEALNVYLNDDVTHKVVAQDFFVRHINDFTILSADETRQILAGTFFEISIDPYSPYEVMRLYEDETNTQLGYFAETSGSRARHFTTTLPKPQAISISDNPVSISGSKALVHKVVDMNCQIRIIADGIYIQYSRDASGNHSVPDQLMFVYNEQVDTIESIATMVSTIQSTMVTQVQEHYMYFVPKG